eukprot:CAMPEP_0202826556 /NCGR_PEP_ID=MMETSP1389-20130828/13690_1 /ASSEMBLY_ACC=CAM_ASM_000865 /TAXON_ID=302021 /ORGANISM="Rhodomonas sp., Strain CCMP768" /LENGTH=113 /DNA_ID=CAMNT_0049499865 /DNA_START=6 /DNA_END=347 /DNA_ORIENTATION=+
MKQQNQESLLLGLSPIQRLVSELRRRFGRFALFWADEFKGDCVAVLWKPAEAVEHPLSVQRAGATFPLAIAGGDGQARGAVIPDVVSMLREFREVGGDIVRDIEVLAGARVVG